jgi:hypothetical protein
MILTAYHGCDAVVGFLRLVGSGITFLFYTLPPRRWRQQVLPKRRQCSPLKRDAAPKQISSSEISTLWGLYLLVMGWNLTRKWEEQVWSCLFVRHDGIWGSGGKAALIPIFDTRWYWVLVPEKRAGTLWIGGWVTPQSPYVCFWRNASCSLQAVRVVTTGHDICHICLCDPVASLASAINGPTLSPKGLCVGWSIRAFVLERAVLLAITAAGHKFTDMFTRYEPLWRVDRHFYLCFDNASVVYRVNVEHGTIFSLFLLFRSCCATGWGI